LFISKIASNTINSLVVGLKDARMVLVSLDVGTEKRNFRRDLEQKTGSGDIRRLGQ